MASKEKGEDGGRVSKNERVDDECRTRCRKGGTVVSAKRERVVRVQIGEYVLGAFRKARYSITNYVYGQKRG